MVNSILKILKGISVECMEILNEDMKKMKKEDRSCDDQIATSPKLLDITHQSYGFYTDLIL